MSNTAKTRYLEIDMFRGILIWCMVAFHFSWDLSYFFDVQKTLFSGVGRAFATFGASSFFVLVGLSSTIQKSLYPQKYNFLAALKRSSKLLISAAIITLAVHFTYPENNIIFGVIHSLGFCTIIVYPFLRLPYISLALAVFIYFSESYVDSTIVETKWLVPIGFRYKGFYSIDYFPLVPQAAYAFLGVFLGNILYPNGLPIKFLQIIGLYVTNSRNAIIRFFVYSGRKTALIYILHQPILYGLCIAVKYLFF